MNDENHCSSHDLKNTPTILLISHQAEEQNDLQKAIAGFAAIIHPCDSAKEAYQYLKQKVPDLLLLASLKTEDRASFCHDFRRIYPWVPIVVVMQENDVQQRIQLLDSGADDCLLQPFNTDELMARIRRALKRFHELYDYYQLERTSCELDAIGLIMNPDKWEVHFKGVLMDLSKTEFKLMELFCLHPNETLARSVLVQKVWRAKPPSSPRTIDNFVMRLRKKLNQVVQETDTPSEDLQLITVHGLGYQLRVRKLKGQQQETNHAG